MIDPRLSMWRQAVPRSPCVVAYHEFALSRSKDVYQLVPSVLAEHLGALRAALADNRQELRITFDDAHRSQIDLAAPVLERFRLCGHFFAPASWVGVRKETAGWNDLRQLADAGHIIGSHGHTHALLTLCSPNALRSELVRSRGTLEDRLGCDVRTISLPGGRFNAAVLVACRAAGYREVYTSDPTSNLCPAQPDVDIRGNRDDTIALYGRLVVRRTTRLRTLTGFAARDPYTMALLCLEHRVKGLLKRAVGDAAYQTAWRGLLRSPAEAILYGKR